MSTPHGSRATRIRAGKVLQLTAILLVAALIAAIAVFTDGFDVKNVKLNSQNIWILQKNQSATGDTATGAGGLTAYGKVNTEVNELTSYNAVDLPDNLVQSSEGQMLFAEGGKRYININSINPIDYSGESEENISLDVKAVSVEMGQNVTALLLESGQVYISELGADGFGAPKVIANPSGVETFSAIAIDKDDLVIAYSSSAKKVFTYNLLSETWNDGEAISGNPSGEFQMATIGKRWALFARSAGQLWVSGSDQAISLAEGAQLQKSSASGLSAFLATPTSLISVKLDSRELNSNVVSVPAGIGTARPIRFGVKVYAAWISQKQGWFYSSLDGAEGELKNLDFGAKTLDPNNLQDLIIHSNGETAVINDAFSGWAWSLPEGKLISGTQDWESLDQKHDPCKGAGCEVDGGKKPKPPVAKPDKFGVRKGELITLPVLLNDSDPNRGDVLTILPESLKGLRSDFGEVLVSSSEQMITIKVSDSASGTADFKYQITDGTGQPNSKPAKVTLTVIAPSDNHAPDWCTEIINNCVQELPTASVRPGSEVSIPYLDGWVDPEGDRFFISSATLVAGEGNVAFTAGGDLVYQNDSKSDKSSSTVTISVTVSDIHGASTTKEFAISVTPDAAFTFDAPVVVLTQSEPLVVDFAEYSSGVQGALNIKDLHKIKESDPIQFEILDGSKVRFTATAAKPSQLSLTLSDGSNAEVSSILRVNALEGESIRLATSPVTVLLSAGLDTTVNVFAAAHNPAGRALVVSGVEATYKTGSLLSADKIKGGNLRIRGRNADGAAGFVGKISYLLSDGDVKGSYKVSGQVFVYVMPETEAKPVVSRRDAVTIRAGATAEVDVLANDLGAPGVPLSLDSKSLQQNEKTSCIQGGLIFAGGNKIRVVAPVNPGGYSCDYFVYAANNPTAKTLATLNIRVIDNDGSGQAPIASDITARVRAGDTVNITVPITGVDPDGDSVLIQTIASVSGDKGAAYINPDGLSIEYAALDGAVGQDSFTYTLVDSFGLVSSPARVKVAILPARADTAPVTVNDYAEVLVGANNRVLVDPIANDFDPQYSALKPMQLVADSVLPDLPESSKNYATWKSAIRQIKGTNQVSISAGENPTTMRFVYTAKGASGSSNTGYIVVKVTGDAIKDAPDVTDTFVTSAQLDDLVNGGIDVVSSKVLWTSGEISKLQLSIWGTPGTFSAVGGLKIRSTEKPENPTVVIFKLSGTNFYGETVESYGLLHLPGTKPRITFDPSASKQTVDENKSVTFDLATLVNVDDALVIGEVKAHGVRPNANCKSAGGTKLTYDAGAGEPWGDFCDVQVKIASSKDDFLTILVPITVVPADPSPVLSDRQLMVVPGNTQMVSFDLREMTDWFGKDTSNLQFKFEGGADLFDLNLKGKSVLEIKAWANSKPGEKRTVKISIPQYPNTKSANLVLVVDQPKTEKPIAPTLVLDCNVLMSANDCFIDAAKMNSTPGAENLSGSGSLSFAPFGYSNGEVNYGSASNKYVCGKITLKTSADKLYATWSDKPEGTQCKSIAYKVIDPEGRVGGGVIEFSFEGIPGNLRSVSQVGYTQSSITLQLVPATSSFPAITGFEIVDEKGDASICDVDENSPITKCVISNLQAYDGVNKSNLHTYKVKAINPQGMSKEAKVLKDAYAFRSPKKLSKDDIRAVAIFDPRIREDRGVAEVTILPVADSSIARYEINGGAGETVSKTPSANFDSFKLTVTAKPGARSKITVTAFGRVDPPVKDIVEENSAVWIGRIVGKPKLDTISAKAARYAGAWSAAVSAGNVYRNFSDQNLNVIFALVPGNNSANVKCEWASSTSRTNLVISGVSGILSDSDSLPASEQSVESLTSADIKNVSENNPYLPYVCVSNGYAISTAFGKTISTLSDPVAGAFAYDVSATPTITRDTSGNVIKAEWLLKLGKEENKSNVTPWFNSSKDKSAAWSKTLKSDVFGAAPVIWVRYCMSSDDKTCSPGERKLEPVDTSRSWQLRITKIAALLKLNTSNGVAAEQVTCLAGDEIQFKLEGDGLTNSSGRNLWEVSGVAGYKTTSNVDGFLEQINGNWKFPPRKLYKSISVEFHGNSSMSKVRGLTGSAKFEFTCG